MATLDWLRGFHPAGLSAPRREALLGSAGVGLSVLVTEWVCSRLLGHNLPWFIAPMGATAVLLFFLPASPMAQPWPVAVGNVLSALVGVVFLHGLGSSGASAAAAVAVAALLMLALRCLHPPGVAVALSVVLGAPAVQHSGFGYVQIVAVNTLVMLATAFAFNNAAGRRYPHHHAPGPKDVLPTARTGIVKEDLEAALLAFGEPLDIDEDDLEEILAHAQQHAQERQRQRAVATAVR